jgi:hypothetical protein
MTDVDGAERRARSTYTDAMKRTVPLAFVAALFCFVAVGAACASSPKKKPAVPAPTEAHSTTATAEEVEADVLAEAKKTAVEQLHCTDEEVTVSCTRHDVHGGCIAVQARGCGNTLEYDFGNDN